MMKETIKLIQQIYEIAGTLKGLTGRSFTPDGHMVGSIGEVFAAHSYNLKLEAPSTEGYDADKDGLKVQIKATAGNRVALYSEPEHLLVFKLENGRPIEMFNGPGQVAWNSAGKKQKNGQRQISLSKLSKLMSQVHENQKLKKVREVE